MIVLPRIEVHLADNILATGENHRDVQAMGETRLIVNAAAGARPPLSEICDQKARAPDFRNDFVIDFVIVVLAIDANWFVSGVSYAGLETLVLSIVH